MDEVVSIGENFTIIVPEQVRERLRLKKGQKVRIRVEGHRIILEPIIENPFKVLEKVIREPYKEEVDEEKAYKWLIKHARG
ncbi:MAG: AbrB/MazE/SpoVT family DNA-binding domain-containing protein [Candidatus Baldrarchaeota archaeon]|nr:AbrB/MazE/SpoVT family DNA-binding domain-containing protein [Candidatus Baldrarchaeota archaeon]